MTILEWFKEKIFNKIGLKRGSNPNDPRLTYINDDNAIRIEHVREYKVWYYGQASELLNYYTNQMVFGWAVNPIYNRNSVNLFWGQSSIERNFKRVHSGIAKAIVDTVSSVVGEPTIKADDSRLDNILEVNNFLYRLANEIRPMVMVEGDGCLKINFNTNLIKAPLIDYYGAEDWEPIYKSQLLLGLLFKTYYKDKNNDDYVLMETRQLDADGCVIEYKLYKIDKNNDLIKVDFSKIPELEGLTDNNRFRIKGIRKLFAVPLRYWHNAIYKDRGESIYCGKITLFDTLDEVLSIESQANRVSVPVEYVDTTALKRDKLGNPILPNKYNRNYVAVDLSTDGDGKTKNDAIKVTQPEVFFEKYSALAKDILNYIFIGRVSPSTLGFDVAKDDNADAQREKEKQTLFTRGNIIDPETQMIKELINMCLLVQDYLDTGVMVDKDYNISVTYDEFANPSFESELQILGPAWSQGQISTEQYVKMLWASKLSAEELEKEKQYLEENKKQDDIDMESLLNGTRNNEGLPTEGNSEEESTPVEE